jgi:hypothetical protein
VLNYTVAGFESLVLDPLVFGSISCGEAEFSLTSVLKGADLSCDCELLGGVLDGF